MPESPFGPHAVEPSRTQGHGGHPKNFILPCLLLLLREGSSHGYDLVERLGPFGYSGEPPVVYRNLRRMEAEGLVESAWETRDKGAARRVYWLTPRGVEHLDAWALAITYQRRVLDTFLDRHIGSRVGTKSPLSVPQPATGG